MKRQKITSISDCYDDARYLIWGTGRIAKTNYEIFVQRNCEDKIIGFLENDKRKWGSSFCDKPVFSPQEITNVEYDYIDIWVKNGKQEIHNQLINELSIPEERIRESFLDVKRYLTEKYSTVQDAEQFLRIMNSREGIEVYGFEPKNNEPLYEVFYDYEAEMNYVLFEKKRMYLANSQEAMVVDGKRYIKNIWFEQDLNSPHLYESGEVMVNEGDVLVDAGVCEGNFALHNIDKVKKCYLIECDPEWMKALKYTFAPYKDKVIFCNKFLGKSDSETTVSLDGLIHEPVNFIKMDIEGGEIDALLGANHVLNQNKNLKCSICCYHKHGDERKIKEILDNHGFKTSYSSGYMFFIYDNDIWKDPELRRGIVRGYK